MPLVFLLTVFDFGFCCTETPVAEDGTAFAVPDEGSLYFAKPDPDVIPLFVIGLPDFPRNVFPPPKGVVVPGVGTLSFVVPPDLSEPGIRPYLIGCPLPVYPTYG